MLIQSPRRLLTSSIRPAMLAGALCACSSMGTMAQPVLWPTEVGGNGNYFEVVVTTSNISWANAVTAAALRTHEGRIGQLASASYAAKDDFIRTLAASTPNAFVAINFQNYRWSGPWIGGFQRPGSPEPLGGWTWLNGDAWTFTNWLTGEPNNGTPPEEWTQLAVMGSPISTSSIGWNDNGSFFPVRSYVVEYVVPAPAAAALLGLGGLLAARRRR